MKISELKSHLSTTTGLKFKLPDGSYVPPHFHLTEVGLITKHFIDCGGIKRQEKMASLQLWAADDYDHRLTIQKFLKILDMAMPILGTDDLDIEVDYQQTTISKFGLDFDGTDFLLVAKQTTCLAQDACGIASLQPTKNSACCSTASCC
jgi:hypothetical protein